MLLNLLKLSPFSLPCISQKLSASVAAAVQIYTGVPLINLIALPLPSSVMCYHDDTIKVYLTVKGTEQH
jgi:uncharacterized protein involved in cysteine biosynthesis